MRHLLEKTEILTKISKQVIPIKTRYYEENEQEQVNPLIRKFNKPVFWNSLPEMCY